jgi:hypothetical protein
MVCSEKTGQHRRWYRVRKSQGLFFNALCKAISLPVNQNIFFALHGMNDSLSCFCFAIQSGTVWKGQ